jgi:iron complex transport system substrate-binding protein
MKKITGLTLAVLILAACGRFKKTETAGNKEQRIVCLSKHLTEMMFALGQGHNLVAVDLTSTYPDSAKLLPTVGYHRALNPEGIISVKPDLVIHGNDIGPANVLPQLEKVGLHIKAFGNANSYDSAKLVLLELGKYFGAEEKADSIVSAMDNDMSKVRTMGKMLKDSPTVMIIHYGQANNHFFVMSGRNGAGDRMILAAGGKPVQYDAKGAREISAEAVAASNPDIIIATNFGYDKMGGSIESFKTVPGVAVTKAAKTNRIYRFEEHDLVYFGPRSGENILKLMNMIHPEIHE